MGYYTPAIDSQGHHFQQWHPSTASEPFPDADRDHGRCTICNAPYFRSAAGRETIEHDFKMHDAYSVGLEGKTRKATKRVDDVKRPRKSFGEREDDE